MVKHVKLLPVLVTNESHQQIKRSMKTKKLCLSFSAVRHLFWKKIMSKSDNRTLTPQQVKQIVSLTINAAAGSQRRISESVGVSRQSVSRIQKKLNELSAEQREKIIFLSDYEIYEMIYPDAGNEVTASDCVNSRNRYLPDFKMLADRMVEARLTKQHVFEKYLEIVKEKNVEALSMGYFYRRLERELRGITPDDYYLLQEFKYGEQLQADFTGDKYQLNTYRGMVSCWIFVLCFPASYYCYAGFVTSQSTEESCRVIGNAVRYFGNRVPRILVSDNAKAFVNYHKGGSYIVNESFENYLTELGICFIPTPVRAPQAKSSAEHSVNMVQRMLKNRNIRFNGTQNTIEGHSVTLQKYIETYINQAPFRRDTQKTRKYLFDTYERNKLRMVTSIPEYITKVKSVVVPRSYHIKLNNHSYSVPYVYIRKYVDVYLLNDYVIIKHEGRIIARHIRAEESDSGSRITTLMEHMPPEHKSIKVSESYLISPDDILHYASGLDEKIYRFCEKRLDYAKRNTELYIHNAISCCKSVINFYEKNLHKNLISEACEEVLRQQPGKWCIREIKNLYYDKLNNEKETEKNQKTSSRINIADCSEAYIRNTFITEQEDGQKYY